MTVSRSAALACAGVLLLAGCARPPLGPMVQVIPGPNKPFGAFQQDQAVCQDYANSIVAGQAEAVNGNAVVGTVLSTVLGAGLGAAIGGGRGAAIGAATGAGIGAGLNGGASAQQQFGIQAQFDNAYVQCMVSRGDQVPGYGPVVASYEPAYPAATDGGLVRAVQAELSRLVFFKGSIDGVAGPQTTRAISAFEASQGLPVDGTPSPFLLDQLRRTPG